MDGPAGRAAWWRWLAVVAGERPQCYGEVSGSAWLGDRGLDNAHTSVDHGSRQQGDREQGSKNSDQRAAF
jgi:hypothetical protein